ncbi:MAG TPA: hypothetical protein VJK53_05025 [Candidatus Paceibacterota bacterium]
MSRYIKIFAVLVIIIGSYLGIRYVGAVIHYACAVPEEDCPPPFRIVGNLGFVLTGGNLVPFWTRN